MNTEKATRYRRTKADITEDIRKAAVDQVMKRGFSASLVTERLTIRQSKNACKCEDFMKDWSFH